MDILNVTVGDVILTTAAHINRPQKHSNGSYPKGVVVAETRFEKGKAVKSAQSHISTRLLEKEKRMK